MNGPVAVSVIIVNWNARDYLRHCLASLQAETLASRTETHSGNAALDLTETATGEGEADAGGIEIFVVDNSSTDGSVEMVRTEFPKVHLLASAVNLGFAGGNNFAAKLAQGRYLFLLNPDTTVPPGTLHTLVAYADAHPEIGALGPQLRNPDGTHQRSCWRGRPGLGMALMDALYLWKLPWIPFVQQSEYRAEELQTARSVGHLLGAALMLRRAAWDQVGALDENYFLFLEETDWCLRAERAGWKIVYLPDAHIIHYGQQSMRQAPRKNIPQFYFSYLRFYRSSHGKDPVGVFLLKSIIALACVIRIGMWRERAVRARDAASRELARAMTLGYRETLRDLPSF